jgi:hypothetical protein
MIGDQPVRELSFSNPDRAAMMLLDPATAQRFFLPRKSLTLPATRP